MPLQMGATDTRDRILDATRAILLDQGIRGFTVDAVATASGSARTTIYRHWPQPRELLVEALGSLIPEFPEPDTGSLHTDLLACARTLYPVLGDDRMRRLMLDMIREAADDSEIARIHRSLVEDRSQPVRLLLQRAIARGEVDPGIDMNLAIALIEGPLFLSTVVQDRPMDDALVNAALDRTLRALA